MFSYTGLTEAQVAGIRNDHHVYMLASSRISVAGCKFSLWNLVLTKELSNLKCSKYKELVYVAQAMDAAVRKYSQC